MFKKYYRIVFLLLAMMSFTLLGYMYKSTLIQSQTAPLKQEPSNEQQKSSESEKDCDDDQEEKVKIEIQTKIVEVLVTPTPSSTSVQKSLNDFLKRYPFFLDCSKTYNPWSFNAKQKVEGDGATPYDYTQEAPVETRELRMTRGFLVYFPVDKINDYMLEFKWLYRSWIEMQKHEPSKWRTDLIVFIDKDESVFNNKDLFFTKLNCSFAFRRTNPNEKPMCTLIEYKSLRKRNLTEAPEAGEKIKQFKLMPLKKRYESILHDFDIFESDNDAINLAPFYSLIKESLSTYSYLDSILMAFDGYNYFRSAGFDYLIRSDMDVFLTPLFGKWLPRHCNDFNVGRGGFSSGFNNNRLKRIAANLNLEYAEIWNLGSTWYSTPAQTRLVSYLTLFGMAYLSAEEFSQPEREGKVGTLLWPEWHYGVLLLYGQSLALNHLIGSNQLNVNKLEDLIDFPSGNVESIFKKLHIHVFHGDDLFSKFVFKVGRYDNMTVSEEDAKKVKFYALKMAQEGKKTPEAELVNQLLVEGNKKN
jgi:hypothetical protein